MKRKIFMVCLIIFLCLAVSFIAQRSTLLHSLAAGQYTGQPVFRNDLEIIAVTLDSSINGHGTEVIPEASMDETVRWLRQFTVGKPLPKNKPLVPGSGAIRIIVTYENGTTQDTAIDHVQIGSALYEIEHPNLPDILPPLD